MANIELVIKIPEELYKNKKGYLTNMDAHMICDAVAKGTPLPKGHGDLIDRDDLLADSYPIDDWSGNEVNIVDVMSVKMADAIIEADTESEDEE